MCPIYVQPDYSHPLFVSNELQTNNIPEVSTHSQTTQTSMAIYEHSHQLSQALDSSMVLLVEY